MIAAFLMLVAATQAAPIACKSGPIERTFGGTQWMVYGCDDGRSILARTKEGNPAAPFYFIVAADGAAYEVYGEGTGDQAASDAAYAELSKLAPATIGQLHAQAVAANPKP